MDYETDGQEPAPEETLAPSAEEASAEADEQQSEAATDDDGSEATANPEPKAAKGVQKRLDELTKRYHDERRDKERLLALLERGGVAAQPQQQAASPDEQPREDQFENYDDFLIARAKYEVRQELKREQQHQTAAQRREGLYAAAEAKYADFREVVDNPDLAISEPMADVILDSQHGADIAYYLGQNPSEASRIASLPPHRQGIEMARIEAKFTAPKPAPKDPPPPPPKPVNGVSSGAGSRDPSKMSMAEYVEWRRQNP